MSSRLTRYRQYDQTGWGTNAGVHILPYKEIEDEKFQFDSSNEENLELTLIRITEDEKFVIINCFNDKGIINKFKTKKKVSNE